MSTDDIFRNSLRGGSRDSIKKLEFERLETEVEDDEDTKALNEVVIALKSDDDDQLGTVARHYMSMGFWSCWTYVSYLLRASYTVSADQQDFSYDESLQSAFIRRRVKAVEGAVCALLQSGLVREKVWYAIHQ